MVIRIKCQRIDKQELLFLRITSVFRSVETRNAFDTEKTLHVIDRLVLFDTLSQKYKQSFFLTGLFTITQSKRVCLYPLIAGIRNTQWAYS